MSDVIHISEHSKYRGERIPSSNNFEERFKQTHDIIYIEHALNELNQLVRQLASAYDGDGGGGNMDLEKRVARLEETTTSIDKNVAVIQEQLKVLKDLPTVDQFKSILNDEFDRRNLPATDNVKVIFDEQITNKKIVNESMVENQINKAKSSLLRWGTGIAVGVVGALTGIIKLFF